MCRDSELRRYSTIRACLLEQDKESLSLLRRNILEWKELQLAMWQKLRLNDESMY